MSISILSVNAPLGIIVFNPLYSLAKEEVIFNLEVGWLLLYTNRIQLMNWDLRERESLKIFSKAFTLVEMLIVVVIIGILSSALLQKLTGYMARTRDLKRQADLRNIAAAIEMYRNDHGEFPKRNISWNLDSNPSIATHIKLFGKTYGDPDALIENLSPYLSSLPNDPQKNSRVCIVRDCFCSWGEQQNKLCRDRPNPTYRSLQEVLVKPWKYLYEIFEHGGALLMAKVETPELANYVVTTAIRAERNQFSGHAFNYQTKNLKLDDLRLCTSVEKGEKPERKWQEDGTIQCFYSSEEQLFYLLKM